MIFDRKSALIKSVLKIVAGILVAIFAFGCGDFLKGKPKPVETIEIPAESVSCLKSISLKVNKFLKSEAENSEIDEVFDCISKTLTDFQNKAEGSIQKDSFTAKEIQIIFGKFIKDIKISQEAANELLTLKSAIIGGGEQFITKAEIDFLKEFLTALKTEAKNLLPYAQLFSFPKGEKTYSLPMIKEGFSQLSVSLGKLLRASKFNRSNYSLADAKRLLTHLNLISDKDDKVMDLVFKINDLILGGQPLMTESDRITYLGNLTEAMRLFEVQRQGYVAFSYKDPQSLGNTLQFLSDVVNFFEDSIQYKKTSLISVDSIDPVIARVHAAKIIPLNLTLDTTLSFYKTAFVRLLGQGARGDIRSFRGIEKIHLLNARRELKVFTLFNNAVAEFYTNAEVGPNRLANIKDVRQALNKMVKANPEAEISNLDKSTQTQVISALKEIAEYYNSPHVVIYVDRKIIISRNKNLVYFKWIDLVKGFENYVLSRWQIMGWGDPQTTPDMKKAEISEEGMFQWYQEFRPFGLEIKSFDPRSINSGPATLKSAVLFTSASNSDNKIDLKELAEHNAILLSGGNATSGRIISELSAARCALPDRDAFENNWQDEKCFIDFMSENYKRHFTNMPDLVTYLDSYSLDYKKEFFKELLEATRVSKSESGKKVETADLRILITVVHYIESLMQLYDANRDQSLDESEIRLAYSPRFKDFATQFAMKNAKDKIEATTKTTGYGCYKEADLIKEFFVFMVMNYRMPTEKDVSLVPCFTIGEPRPLFDLHGQESRRGLINTFKILRNILAS